MKQLDHLNAAEAFDRSRDAMLRQIRDIAFAIADQPASHTLSLHVEQMIIVAANLNTTKDHRDLEPLDWRPEKWAEKLHLKRTSVYKVYDIAAAAGAVRGRFAAMTIDVDRLLRWTLGDEPTAATLEAMATAIKGRNPSRGRQNKSATRTKKSATRINKSATRIQTSITHNIHSPPQGDDPTESLDDPWRVVVSELQALRMKRAPRAIEAAQSRDLDPAAVRDLVERWERLRARQPDVTVAWLYRWLTGESDPPEDAQPLTPAQTSLMDRETQANLIRLRTVKRGRAKGATEAAIERAVQTNLQRAGLLDVAPAEATR